MSKRSKPLLNVPAFGYHFVLLNRLTGLSYSFDTLSEVFRYIRPYQASDVGEVFSPSNTLLTPTTTDITSFGATAKNPPFFLSNHLGACIDMSSLIEEFHKWKKWEKTPYRFSRKKTSAHIRQDMLDKRLIKTKHSPLKIKTTYQKTWSSSWFDSEQVLKNNQVGMYRHVKTRAERRWNKAHSDKEMQQEGAYHVVRPSRNRLPTYWDDALVSMHHGEKSWKHHSKRKHQYKPK